MSCYHPIKGFRTASGVVFAERRGHDVIGDIEIPCGQCIGCRMRRAADWTLRCMHEASLYEANCFVTLTYGRDCVPADGSLEHRDWQLFMKRLRRHFKVPVRFYGCGEYGPLNLRPHFHACLFGVDFRADRVPMGKSGAGAVYFQSPLLDRLWTYGRCSVQDLTRETAGYCARYIMKKQLGPGSVQAYVTDDGVIRRREYAFMSLKPGIGARWFERYGRDVYPHDFVVADGAKHSVPRYYDRLKRRSKDVEFDEVEYRRVQEALKHAEDNTEARRIVREKVHEARMSVFQRGDCDDAS